MLQQLRRTFEQVVTMTIISATRACRRSQLWVQHIAYYALSAAEGVLIFILVQFLLGGGGVKYGGKVLKHEINKWKLYSMFIQCLHIIS